MTNPYQTNGNLVADATKKRSVLGCVVGSLLLLFFAFHPLSIGLAMLGNELGLFWTTSGIYGIEINGVAVSNQTFIAATLSIGLLLLLGSLLFAVRAWRNSKVNAGSRPSNAR
jgi:hypothetical protein